MTTAVPKQRTEGLLPASEVARRLGLHINTVKRIPPEALPFVRITPRGDRRYDPADVRLYLRVRSVMES